MIRFARNRRIIGMGLHITDVGAVDVRHFLVPEQAPTKLAAGSHRPASARFMRNIGKEGRQLALAVHGRAFF